MANRFPLILDADAQRIKELSSGDNLDLTGNGIVAVRSIIPETTLTYDLGSADKRWRDLYLSGGTVYVGAGSISYDVVQSKFIFSEVVDGISTPIGSSLGQNTTDDLTEGTTNLYFTNQRIDDHLSGGTGVGYSGGVISIGQAVGITDNVTFNDLTVDGDLIVNGTTTTVNSTTTTLDDPILTLGGDIAPTFSDAKDRGVEFRWYNGIAAKVGFFGFNNSSGKFTFIPDATNTSEVFSGTKGTLDANVEWADILNKPDPVVTVTLTGDVTGTADTTLTDLASGTVTISTTIAANSVALGTDTTGNYIATIAGTTNQISVSGSGSETAAVTLSLPQDIHNQATPTFTAVKLGSTGTEVALDRVVTTTLSTVTPTTVDSWAVATYRSAKYTVQVTQGSNYQVSEVLVIHDGTNAFMAEYAILQTSGVLGNLTTDVNGGNVRLFVTMGSASSATVNIKANTLVV